MVGLSVAVVTFGAALWPPLPAASADPISSAKAQVNALQAQVVTSSGRIRDLTLAYEEANTRASALAQQVSTDRAQLAALQGRFDSTRRALRAEAILGYTGASAGTPSGVPGTVRDLVVRAEYLQVAAGDMSNTLDQYRLQQTELSSAESALAGELKASSLAAAATASARQLALTEAVAVQSELQNVQAHLSQLVAAQAAAEAAAKAQAAAQAAAAAASNDPATQGLPVNGGLVSVVRNVVAPTPPVATVVAAPAPGSSPGSSAGGAGGVWLQLRECESGDDYQANTGNGFYGAYQFSASTWTGLGYPGRPDLEPPALQDQAAQRLQARSGWGQWPACSAALGLH